MLLFFLLWQMFFNRPPNSFFYSSLCYLNGDLALYLENTKNSRQRIFWKLQKDRHMADNTGQRKPNFNCLNPHPFISVDQKEKPWPPLLLHLVTKQKVFGMFHMSTDTRLLTSDTIMRELVPKGTAFLCGAV